MAPLPVGNALREEVLMLERNRADAMVRQDLEALASLLADDLSYTHSDGRTDTKESFLDLVAGPALRYLGIDYANQEVLDCGDAVVVRSEEHTSELQSLAYLVCRLLLEKKKKIRRRITRRYI